MSVSVQPAPAGRLCSCYEPATRVIVFQSKRVPEYVERRPICDLCAAALREALKPPPAEISDAEAYARAVKGVLP